jgi:hypothetical protein
VAYVEQRWAIRFSIPGIPHKFSEKKKQFIEFYENLKKTAGDDRFCLSMPFIRHRRQSSVMGGYEKDIKSQLKQQEGEPV